MVEVVGDVLAVFVEEFAVVVVVVVEFVAVVDLVVDLVVAAAVDVVVNAVLSVAVVVVAVFAVAVFDHVRLEVMVGEVIGFVLFAHVLVETLVAVVRLKFEDFVARALLQKVHWVMEELVKVVVLLRLSGKVILSSLVVNQLEMVLRFAVSRAILSISLLDVL